MTGPTLQNDGVLHPALLGCLEDTEHDWRLLELVSKKFCGVWRQHHLQVLEWRVAFLEATVDALEAKIEDVKRGCSCGYALGWHNCPWC
jgi:hypothetical protein